MSEKEKIEIAYKNGMSFGEEQQLYWKKEDYLEADKDKEIERLKNVINTMDKEIDNLCKNQKKEIERLKNNWNKLEEWLNIQQNISSPEQILNDIFNKIEELKGDGNNESR